MKLKWDIHELTDFGERVGDSEKFDKVCRAITVQLAKELHEILFKKTPVKTGQLAAGWGGAENYSYKIIERKNGYEIQLINRVEYALYVNDGHYSYNQYGGPYEVKHRTVPYYQGNHDRTFVFGHFFVEKSILELENGDKLNKILFEELEKWFRWCVNGK